MSIETVRGGFLSRRVTRRQVLEAIPPVMLAAGVVTSSVLLTRWITEKKDSWGGFAIYPTFPTLEKSEFEQITHPGFSGHERKLIDLAQPEGELLTQINVQRMHRLSRDIDSTTLELDEELVVYARMRSFDMAARNYFSHTSPEGETAFSILDDYSYPHGWAGENLARNNYPLRQSPFVAIRDQMASPGHAANNLNLNFDRIGIGYYRSRYMHFFTTIFVQYTG